MTRDKAIETLQMIAADMERDMREFEGAYFNGKTVATMFGRIAAAVAATATILGDLLKELEP